MESPEPTYDELLADDGLTRLPSDPPLQFEVGPRLAEYLRDREAERA